MQNDSVAARERFDSVASEDRIAMDRTSALIVVEDELHAARRDS